MKKETKRNLIGVIVCLIITIIAFTWLSDYPEPVELIFNRPVGGEERVVQKVRLYCFNGVSKGAPETNMWCQEEILEEWADE